MSKWKIKALSIMPNLKKDLKCDICNDMCSSLDVLENIESDEKTYVCHKCSRELRKDDYHD